MTPPHAHTGESSGPHCSGIGTQIVGLGRALADGAVELVGNGAVVSEGNADVRLAWHRFRCLRTLACDSCRTRRAREAARPPTSLRISRGYAPAVPPASAAGYCDPMRHANDSGSTRFITTNWPFFGDETNHVHNPPPL